MPADRSNEFASADYVAVVESSAVNPDGSRDPEGLPLVVDAAPVSSLSRLRGQLADLGAESQQPRIDFLALTARRPNGRLLEALDTGGLLSISVAQRAPVGDNEIAAFATGLNGIDNDNLPFAIRINERAPSPQHVRTLRELANFRQVPDATEFSDFEQMASWGVAVAVYDVGQASMSAVVDGNEHPLIFFDLGWPASFNNKSKPLTATDFNPLKVGNGDAPVVLSHLDWDHWAFAYDSGAPVWDAALGAWKTVATYRAEALQRQWLMRRPRYASHKLGPSHIHFVQELHAKGALRFWPAKRKKLPLGPVTVFTCNPAKGVTGPAAFLRNNQGLGMLVSHKDGAKVLLPGDADYPSIPAFATQGLTGLVATHHGGKVTPDSVPAALGHGRLVMSVFEGCYSSIPHSETAAEASQKGWHVARTDERGACFRAAKPHGCGNRLIRLSGTPQCGCGGAPDYCACITKLPRPIKLPAPFKP